MNTTVRKAIELTLILDEEEIKWLKDYTQNYAGNGLEDKKDEDMRKKFFDACHKTLGNSPIAA